MKIRMFHPSKKGTRGFLTLDTVWPIGQNAHQSHKIPSTINYIVPATIWVVIPGMEPEQLLNSRTEASSSLHYERENRALKRWAWIPHQCWRNLNSMDLILNPQVEAHCILRGPLSHYMKTVSSSILQLFRDVPECLSLGGSGMQLNACLCHSCTYTVVTSSLQVAKFIHGFVFVCMCNLLGLYIKIWTMIMHDSSWIHPCPTVFTKWPGAN